VRAYLKYSRAADVFFGCTLLELLILLLNGVVGEVVVNEELSMIMTESSFKIS